MSTAIIIPSYNREQLLPMCLDSVLRQTRPPEEILVVDDGSTDATAALCRTYPPVRYLHKENGGPGSARNLGLRNTTSESVIFLDSDDILADRALELLRKGFEAYPDVAVVFGRPILFRGKGLPPGTDRQTWPKPEEIHALLCDGRIGGVARVSRDIGARMLRYSLIVPGSALVRRSALDAVGPWDEGLLSATDQDLWLRITARFSIAYVEGTVLFYRRHQGALTDSDHWLVFQTQILRVLEKVMRADWADAGLRRKAKAHFARRASKVSRLYAGQGDLGRAARLMWKTIRHRPFSLKSWARFGGYAIRARREGRARRGGRARGTLGMKDSNLH